jgi:hypothetical protein
MKALSARQAAFVQHCLAGKSNAEAAKLAGFRGEPKGSGYRLSKLPAVKAALEAGRQEVMLAGQVTAQSLLAEAQAASAFARERGNPMALVKSLELIGKLTGLLVERRDERLVGSVKVEIVRFSSDD